MKPCVLYVSFTGNTKRLAEAISDLLKAPLFDVATPTPPDVGAFDLLVIGTPVIGLNPAPALLAFVNSLPVVEGKQAVLFCTYAFMKGGVLNVLEEKLAAKGYRTVLSVGKRGVKPGKSNFQDVLDKIAQVVKE
jgi:flavorubredoxin